MSEKYAYLTQLPSEELEEIMIKDFEKFLNGLAEPDTDKTLFILEVLEARSPESPEQRQVRIEKAWKEFQQKYCHYFQ